MLIDDFLFFNFVLEYFMREQLNFSVFFFFFYLDGLKLFVGKLFEYRNKISRN